LWSWFPYEPPDCPTAAELAPELAAELAEELPGSGEEVSPARLLFEGT